MQITNSAPDNSSAPYKTLEGSLVIRGETGWIHDMWERERLHEDGVRIAGGGGGGGGGGAES